MRDYIVSGAMVIAIAGREKGESFIVLETQNDYAYIINGKTRTINSPKKKKIKHLQLLCKSELVNLDMNTLTDALVKKYLDNYNKSRVK